MFLAGLFITVPYSVSYLAFAITAKKLIANHPCMLKRRFLDLHPYRSSYESHRIRASRKKASNCSSRAALVRGVALVISDQSITKMHKATIKTIVAYPIQTTNNSKM